MAQQFDPHKILEHLQGLSVQLLEFTNEAERLDEEAVRAAIRHEMAYARAYTTGAGSIEDRKQAAKLLTESEALDAELAAAKLRACQRRIQALRQRIDVGRSLNAAQRSEWAAAGVVNQ